MKVAFRVDVTPSVGFGHLLRCLSLAEVFTEIGVEVVFVCSSLPAELNDRLKTSQIAVVIFEVPRSSLSFDDVSDSYTHNQHLDAGLTIESLKFEKVDVVIVDHYGLDSVWESLMRPYCKTIVAFDDFTGRHHCCDYIIDQNISDLLAPQYLECNEGQCNLLTGYKYSLVSREYRRLRMLASVRTRLTRILVYFTSGNDCGQTKLVLSALKEVGFAGDVDVVASSNTADDQQILNLCECSGWMFHRYAQMSELAYRADLAFGSCGVHAMERCVLGLPSITTVLSTNQINASNLIVDSGASLSVGWHEDVQVTDYATLTYSADLEQLSTRALNLIDGAGAFRILEAIMKDK